MKKIGNVMAALLLFCCVMQVARAQDHRNPTNPTSDETAHYAWADVLRVDPIYDPHTASDSATTPKQECYDEQVPQPAPKDNRVGGTIIGAIVGGIFGNAFGKGSGRKIATATGVVAGAAVGNSVAAQSSDAPAMVTERHCRNLDGTPAAQRRITAYDVEYRYRGEVYMARVAYDPGDRMRVRVSVVPAE